MTQVELRSIAKQYGSIDVIHDVNLDIAQGEFIVFVGPSGCGKSTLLRMIAGLESISSGKLLLDGDVVNTVPASERGLAMVFQSYALYPHMSVYRNMAFGLETAGMAHAEIEARVRSAAEKLRIDELLDRKPRQLSGGQRQRVAIGRAIVREPRLFLFDEPLSNLDADLRVQMRVELIKLHQNLKTTMIYVTHDQIEAMTMADRIVVLNRGRIEQIGTPLDIYNNPVNRFVATFIGSPRMNFIATDLLAVSGGVTMISLPGGKQFSLPIRSGACIGDQVCLGIRPEHIKVVDRDADMAAEVVLAEQLGDQTVVYAKTVDGQSVTIQTAGQQHWTKGALACLELNASNCHLFDAEGNSLRPTSA